MDNAKDEEATAHLVACFVRVDVEVVGEPSMELYNEVGEALQNGVQDFLLDRQARLGLDFMTCRVIGPLSADDLEARDDLDKSLFELLGELEDDLS